MRPVAVAQVRRPLVVVAGLVEIIPVLLGPPLSEAAVVTVGRQRVLQVAELPVGSLRVVMVVALPRLRVPVVVAVDPDSSVVVVDPARRTQPAAVAAAVDRPHLRPERPR